jgi:hypothetical protein
MVAEVQWLKLQYTERATGRFLAQWRGRFWCLPSKTSNTLSYVLAKRAALRWIVYERDETQPQILLQTGPRVDCAIGDSGATDLRWWAKHSNHARGWAGGDRCFLVHGAVNRACPVRLTWTKEKKEHCAS